ncbi:MAG TPA: M4 family metallopeptidase [Dermatophilaceae bacterium]
MSRLRAGIAFGALLAVAVAGGQGAPAVGAPGPAPSPVSNRVASIAAEQSRAVSAGQALGLGAGERLIVKDVITDPDGTTHVRYNRTFDGLRVIGGDLVSHRARSGKIKSVSWNAAHTVAVASTTPRISLASARAAGAQRAASVQKTTSATKGELVVYSFSGTSRKPDSRLAYDVLTNGVRADQTPSKLHTIVDANTGATLLSFDEIKDGTGNGTMVGPVTVGTTAGPPWSMRDTVGSYTTDLNGLTSGSSDGFTGMTPTRVLDTRNGIGAPAAKLGAGATLTLTVPGLPAGVTAVAFNVTATGPSAGSYLTVFPGGGPRPTASSLNFVAGQTIPNMVLVDLGPGNTVRFYNAAGTVNVIADLVGYHRSGTGAGLTGTVPTRVLDTRNAIGAPAAELGPGATLTLTVPGLPAGATAVALNVTATGATAGSYLTVFPGGGSRPTASSLNFVAGQTIPNMVLVNLGPGNTVNFYNAAGSVDVIADLVGHYMPTANAGLTGTVPTRVLDTRHAVGAPAAKLGPGATLTLTIPGLPAGATAVALNVTVTGATAGSYLTVFPGAGSRPTASSLNFVADQTIPNMVLVNLGPGNTVRFYNAAGSVSVIADLVGYYIPGMTLTDADNIWGNGSVSDRASVAVDAHYGAGKTFDYFKNVLGRNGIWNTGVGAPSRVHYGDGYQNAYWDGTQMTYGDGMGNTHPLTELDVAAHEMTHGVTDNTAELVYTAESGGLNEATSDIFGTAVEFYTNNGADNPDYLIGEKIDLNGDGTPLRYMDEPSRDGESPNCWSPTVGNLDVHLSSGPLNHWFYLASEGSGAKVINGVSYNSPTCDLSTVTPIGRDKAAAIWYRTLSVYLTSSNTYAAAREGAIQSAKDLYGDTSTECTRVAASFSAIDVPTGAATCRTASPPPVGTNLLANPGFERGNTLWSATPGVIDTWPEWGAPRSGTWNAWLNGRGFESYDSISQLLTIPAGRSATLSYYVLIGTDETGSVAFDTLTVRAGSTVLQTWSNADAADGYQLETVSLSAYAGRTISLSFAGAEDGTLFTSFVLDDLAVTTS